MTSHEPQSLRTRILVVEDQPAVAQVIAEVLEADGHDVETAANGRLALDMIEARPYDLIISDLHMPELDGVGLYREIKRRQPALLSRFLFVSGTAHEPEYHRFLVESAVPILAKPFTLADLQRLTRHVLEAHGPEPDRT
jgi:two-component system NtrC family sensor kinase